MEIYLLEHSVRWTLPRILSLLGTVIVIPWELLSDFVISLVGQGHNTTWNVALMWFAFRLNIAAVLLSWIKPRLAAWWILINIAVSMSIVTFWFSPSWGMVGKTFGVRNPLEETLKLLYSAALVLIAPAIFAIGMLVVLQKEQNSGNGALQNKQK